MDLVIPAHGAGEAIIGLIIEPIVNNLLEFLGLCLAAIVVWCLYLLYYHIHPGQQAHAFRQSKTRGLLFAYSHWLLGCAFLFTATSLRLIIATYPSFNPESERQAGAIADAPAEAPTPLKLAAAVSPGLGATWQQLPYPGRRMLAEGGNSAEMESRATRYHIKDGTPSHDVSALFGERGVHHECQLNSFESLLTSQPHPHRVARVFAGQAALALRASRLNCHRVALLPWV